MPPRFRAAADARTQIAEGLEAVAALIGAAPRGMWPSEGSLSAAAVGLMARCGVAWAAGDADVLRAAARDGDPDITCPWRLEGAEGIDLVFRDHELSDRIGFTYARIEPRADGLLVSYDGPKAPPARSFDSVLVAVGRTPNVDGLGLDAAGVAFSPTGITVNDSLRTTNRRVYAAGDVCSRYKFTHAADAMARIVLHNALFFGRQKVSALVVPWTTYTDPEVAHVGLSAAEAQARGDTVATLTVPLSAIDRAVLESRTDGFARVHVERRSGRILGATMVASHAGDMIGEVALALKAGLSLGVVGDTIHPYPTYAAAWKRLGDDWKRTRLTPGVQALLRTILRWRR